ncbi:MAG: type I-C CRISPR-associated protein Cas7/Csd2 [Planctomycetes bacterium]|nr:type I-C CRISPR-associated protein Cas7/Csd2 [Planctomycetota bacterium]
MSAVITNRHDVYVLFDVTNGNPNGDPDAGNMPRIDPNTNRGIISDVCLKRKVRNFVLEFGPKTEGKDGENGFGILIRQGAVIETEQKRALKATKDSLPDGATDADKAEAAGKWLCREFFDVRTFGCVLSTGKDVFRGSAFGQLRGPVQVTFGQSFHGITPLEVTISVCAARSEGKTIEEQTGIQGHKHIVPYALYAAKCYVSPAFAERTGFTQEDLDLFFEALVEMFTHDKSAARGEMIVRGIYDFEHVGTQHENNAEQKKREARLGCYHAHKLFDGIKVGLRGGKSFPESFADYEVKCEWTEANLPNGVRLHLRHEQPLRTIAPNM